MTSLKQAHITATARLKPISATPALDARLLLQAVTGLSHEALLMQGGDSLTRAQQDQFETVLATRLAGCSVARILGQREFYGLPFGLNATTLEPRADSEVLVDWVRELSEQTHCKKILDLGTGTGCLLLACLAHLPEARGLGVDLSAEALAQAKENARNLDLSARADFLQSNWFDAVEKGQVFDLILSNPPYIRTAEIAELAPDVRDFDPILALDGGADGLDSIRHIISHAPDYLAESGLLLLEIGADQGAAVAELLAQAGWRIIDIRQDLAGCERCVKAMRPA